MGRKDNPTCIYCNGSKVIRHGKTSTGNIRYRCRICNKTWVAEKNETVRPELSDIVEAYLSGRTCRDLVSAYKSSPLRINQKIREFLEGCPHWEDYLDACLPKHEPRMIYLTGRNFSCACKSNTNNSMYLAMAADALSNVVLGYEIEARESREMWIKLLDRMNCRGITSPIFMANGSKIIEDAVQVVFPYSTLRIFYHRAFRDKELQCCLSRLPINNKLMNDALKAYDTLKNKNLSEYLKTLNESKIKDYLLRNPEMFLRRLKDRFENKPRNRMEGLISGFQTRFEKFHMVKDDPRPLVNGWIARWMITRLEVGFSRLAFYIQVPCITTFKNFSCGQKPIPMTLTEDSPLLQSFVIDVAARGLQIPVFYSKCEMKLDKCSLF